ncbi:MAG: hypothetical protein B7Z55_10300 [Planctomycetales bacterium 12-60-4]|nr:MAG: hypothetical protein B7Z55_10300 [Planctomycetales bacterium 12-60-4]
MGSFCEHPPRSTEEQEVAQRGRPWKTLASGIIVGVAATWLSASFHVVRTRDRCLLLSRTEVGWSDMYADIRTWNADDWRRHPRLYRAMVQAGLREQIPTVSQQPTGGSWLPWRRAR